MASARQPLYGVGLLDDLHTYFPDLLYNPDRFTTTGSVLRYIRDQTESQFNLFARGQREAQQSQPQQPQNPVLTTPIRPPAMTTPAAPARRIRPQRHWSETGAEGPYGAGGYGVHIPQINHDTYINPIENIITETYDVSSLFQIPNTQRQSTQNATNSLMSILLNAVTGMPRADLEPVVVRPDNQTIDRTTTLRPARETDENEVCSVCQDHYTEGQAIRSITHCSHMFHKSCIDQWFERDVHCPVCRFDVRQTPNNN
jgi:hypothetical protein